MYDVIIIGAGPAGISASLYTKRANLNTLVLYYGESALIKAKIDNYYGFPEGIEGKELYSKGIEQAKNIGVDVKEIEVLGIENNGTFFIVKTLEENYNAKAIILSTGNKKIKPDIPGVIEYEGKGISYCAICDGFFFKSKKVAVIGNGNFAISEAKHLKNVTEDIIILTNGLEKPKCEFKVNTKKIKEILGEEKVTKILFEDESIVEIDGVFIALGKAGAGDFAKTLGIIQENDSIKVDENMQTNIKGIYACGDNTGGVLQVSKSVYEGSVAALSTIKYIKEEGKEN